MERNEEFAFLTLAYVMVGLCFYFWFGVWQAAVLWPMAAVLMFYKFVAGVPL